MNRDDIIRMARAAADYWANHYDRKSKADMELLRKHVAEKFLEIAAAEREECAKIVDRWHDGPSSEPEMAEIAAEIRARGNSEKP
jgi:hypothetical protein